MKVLGVSGPPRDSAVCLVIDGVIRVAAQEERFTRRPHDGTLPIASLACCLETGEISSISEIDAVVFYETMHERWLRQVLPEFAGDVTLAMNAHDRFWTAAAPSNAAAAIRIALGKALDDVGADSTRPASVALGPSYTSAEVRELLDRFDLPYELVDDVPSTIARLAAEGNVTGVVRDRMEFGDVSLGHRSLVVLAEDESAVRRMTMLAAADARALTATAEPGTFLNQLDIALKQLLPASTLAHVPFRTTDEPTVCSPIDAYRCMMRGGIDAVVVEDVLIRRREQPAWPDAPDRS